MSIGIYKITNTVTGVFYIGSSVEIEKRFQQHKADLRNNHHGNQRLQNSFNKHGENNFKFEIIELCKKSLVRDLEQKYIDDTKCYKRGIGYNINQLANGGGVSGKRNHMYGNGHLIAGEKNGFFGKRHTEETKRIISEKNSGFSSPWFGRNHTSETRKKMSEAQLGKEFSEEHRKNLSIAMTKAQAEGKFKPATFSDRARQRQILSQIKGVRMLNLDGEYIKSFPSVKAAAMEIGVNSENISRVCKGRNETSKGYRWEYSQTNMQE